MSSRRNASIYILTGLLIVVGILIFAFKDSLLTYLSARVFGENSTSAEVPLKASAASVISLDILEDSNFKNLENHVKYFDFNYVGKPAANSATGATVQPPVWRPVYLGNATPFLVEVKAAATSTSVK